MDDDWRGDSRAVSKKEIWKIFMEMFQKISPLLSYMLLMTVFVITLIIITSQLSTVNSEYQTNLFVHRYQDYFQNLQNKFHGGFELGSLINSLQGVGGYLGTTQNIFTETSVYFIDVFLTTLLIFAYLRKKVSINLENFSWNFPNDLTYTILMTLVFSIAIAFYFSSNFIETSSKEIITQMISDMTPQNVGNKIVFIQIQLDNVFAAFEGTIINETYFFIVFAFLVIGAILRRKVSYFSQIFFGSAVIAILFWLFYYSVHLISS